MKKIILCSNSFPGQNEEPFLRTEFPFLEKYAGQIYIHRNETVLPVNYEYILLSKTQDLTPIRNIIALNWKLLIDSFLTEFLKSNQRFHYLINYKKYFNIWMGWLQEAKAWEEILKNFNPQDTIIYTYWYEQQANALTVLRAQGKLPFKWVSRAHGWDVDKSQRPDNIIPFRHWMLKHKPDHLVSISSFGKHIFEKEYGAKAEVSRLGTLDLGMSKLNLDANTLKIVSISAIIPLKRVELIVKVLSACKVNIAWTHFGDGPLMDSIPWEALPSNIAIVKKGHLKHEELLTELKETGFDLMLHFSELEGIPVSIMECMSLGIPVMACDAGGVKEILNNNNGWLLPIDLNILETARTIENIAENKELIQEKKQKALDTWEKEYNATVNFPQFIETYLS